MIQSGMHYTIDPVRFEIVKTVLMHSELSRCHKGGILKYDKISPN
jgi:hypothetical protein